MKPNRDKFSTLYSFEESRAALRALSQMLAATMSQGDSLADIAMGVSVLLDNQCNELADIEQAVRNAFLRLETEEQTERHPKAKALRDQFIAEKAREGVDAGEIAQAVNLKRSAVEKVIAQLTGSAPASSSGSVSATA